MKRYRDSDYARIEIELRKGFCDYATELLKITDSEEDFADSVASRFLANNRWRDKQNKTIPFWRSLDPLDRKYKRIPIQKHKSSRHHDEISKTSRMLFRRFEKWNYSRVEAIQFLLNCFCIDDNTWLWSEDVLPSYAECLAAYQELKALSKAEAGALAEAEGLRIPPTVVAVNSKDKENEE